VPPPPPPPARSPSSVAGPGIPPGVQLSTKGKRFGAFLLDLLLAIVTLGIGWLIWDIILWGRGQSPAKQILHMRVLDLKTGRGASWGPMLLRELVGKWLLGCIPLYTIVSAIVLLVDERSQALWDKIAGTVVVEDPDDRLAP
jgi:uncharacterized RDD family membrane protein YckC